MQRRFNLYEYSINETQFSAKIKLHIQFVTILFYLSCLSEFKAEMCLMRITGIYETKVPLIFKALTQIGSTCRMNTIRNTTEISLDQFSHVRLHQINSPGI